MSSETSFLRAQVWGMFLEAAGFGIYAVTCSPCFRAFFGTGGSSQRGSSGLNCPMLTVFFVFLAKTVSSAVLQLRLNLEVVGSENLTQAAIKLMDGSRPIHIAKVTTVLIQSLILSGVLIHRCWLIYGRTWSVVAFPLVLWLGGVAVMGLLIHIDSSDKVDGLFAISEAHNFGSSFWAIITTVNIITSGLIARRVWSIDHLRSQSSFYTNTNESTIPAAKIPSGCLFISPSREKMKQARRTIIESGLIYTTIVVLYPAIDLLVQIIGITFNLIIIRNRPQTDISDATRSNLNGVPLHLVSSNMSVSGSAIEFAYPKHFTPRRKNQTSTSPVQGDLNAPSVPEISHNHSQQSEHCVY
ncbi:hypothetical protein B0H15DRAFT_797951 [Mycena belliarum]|uniref:Uncharacterized protein n=1 Tax=Mycena belliarum TaxID=1033014 RepID=A0AAD6XUU2_9AGAR|nr:hypothetical protein B0H15DRAFT_797951 [Mycena belliae]